MRLPGTVTWLEVDMAKTEDKAKTVQVLAEEIKQSSAAIVTDYRGLTVRQMGTLRQLLRREGCRYRVAKNTLMRRALAAAEAPDLGAMLEGPTAVVFCPSDPLPVARVLAGFIRENRLPVLKGGVLQGKLMTAEQVRELATMPGREVLLAQLVGAVQSPLAGLVGALQGLLRNAMMTVQAYAEQKASA